MGKKFLIFCSCMIVIIIGIFIVTMYRQQRPIRDQYIKKETAYYFSKEELQEKNITVPGEIDYAIPQVSSVFQKMGSRAFYGTVTEVFSYYVKKVDGASYQQCNMVQVKIKRGYSGGYASGDSTYIVDPGLQIHSNDVGKVGIFIPDNTGCEINSYKAGERVKVEGVLVPEENRFLLGEQEEFEKIWNIWQVKRLWKKKYLVE